MMDLSSILCVQTSSEAHPASYPMGTFPGDKALQWLDADHSPHLVPRSRMSGSYTSSPPWRCKVKVGQFYSLLWSISSSSSLARQPYVGPGLPQKFLPAEVSGYCFFRFCNKSLLQGAVVSPTPNPRLFWKADVFCQGCLPQSTSPNF
jgi:hypothetical protein